MKKVVIITLAVIVAALGITDIVLMSMGAATENITIISGSTVATATYHPDFAPQEVANSFPGENLALNKDISAKAYVDGYGPARANDGDAIGSYWEGSGPYPQWLKVDIGEETKIIGVRVRLKAAPEWGRREQTFAVVCTDAAGNSVTAVEEQTYTFDCDEGNCVEIHFEPIAAKTVELVFSANTGGAGGQIAEFEVY